MHVRVLKQHTSEVNSSVSTLVAGITAQRRWRGSSGDCLSRSVQHRCNELYWKQTIHCKDWNEWHWVACKAALCSNSEDWVSTVQTRAPSSNVGSGVFHLEHVSIHRPTCKNSWVHHLWTKTALKVRYWTVKSMCLFVHDDHYNDFANSSPSRVQCWLKRRVRPW